MTNSVRYVPSGKDDRQFGRKTRTRILLSGDGIDGRALPYCGDHGRDRRRHLSKHGTDREAYMEEYDLSLDELVAKDFRRILDRVFQGQYRSETSINTIR